MTESRTTTTLAGTLDQIRNAAAAKRDPAITAVLQRCTADLVASGITDRIVKEGDTAPLFARPNLEHQTVRLAKVLRRGPAVVSFFRGRW